MFVVCCVDTDTDSVVVETEDDSSDTEYTPDEKPNTGMFDVSYFLCCFYVFNILYLTVSSE